MIFRYVARTAIQDERKRLNSGFSLIQIMISISLFCLVAGLLVVNFRFLNRYLLRSEVDKLFNTFRYLQSCAIATGKNQVLKFDIENNQYCFEEKKCQLPDQVIFGVMPEVKGPPSCPKKIINSPITFKKNQIIFCSDGIISSGTVYIADSRKSFLYAISSNVAQVSYLRKYAYDGNWNLIK